MVAHLVTNIPKVVTDNFDLNKVQDNLKTVLEPIVRNYLIDGLILSNIALVNGSNVINHKLDRNLVGWFIVRQRSAATVYDTQDTNTTPQFNLNLVSSASVTVDLYVF